MGFPCERVRHKIEQQHRKHNNYTRAQWSDNNIDDCLSTKSVTVKPAECARAFDGASALNGVTLCNCHNCQPQCNEPDLERIALANGGTSINSRLHHQPQKPIGNGFIERITQLISFNSGHRKSTLSPTQTPTKTTAPPVPERCATADAPITVAVCTTTTTTATTTTATSSHHSQYLVRQSLCLYAASSFLLVLCYFATTAAAATDPAHPM